MLESEFGAYCEMPGKLAPVDQPVPQPPLELCRP